MGIFVSTGAFKTRKLREILDMADKNNIRNIELSPGLEYDPQTADIVYDAHKDFNFLIHNYFPTPKEGFALNLASDNMKTQELSINMCKEAMDICHGIGAPYYSVHCGFCFDTDGSALGNSSQTKLDKIPREDAMKRFVSNVGILADYGREIGVGVVIENNVAAEFVGDDQDLMLGVTAEEILELISRVDRDRVGFLIDLAHAKVSSNTYGFDMEKYIETTRACVREVHISENNGRVDQNLPINRDGDIYRWLSNYKDQTITIEVYNLSVDEILRQIDIVNDAIS